MTRAAPRQGLRNLLFLRYIYWLCAGAVALCSVLSWAQPVVSVGSKRFTESYIVGEIIAQTARRAGDAASAHRRGLGNTAIVFSALKSGAIDVYPEYTGTIALELLGMTRVPDLPQLNEALARHGLSAGVPLGFANGYALAVPQARAAELGISTMSDLARHPELRYGLSQEFLRRKDGWPALSAAYGLGAIMPRGLDHGVAYEAVAGGAVDVIDIYTTDPKVARHALRVLVDDRRHFPAYDAVLLYRQDLPERAPRAWRALQALEGRISTQQMTTMNAAAELSGQPFEAVAARFLTSMPEGAGAAASERTLISALVGEGFWQLTGQHLMLVCVSLGMGIVVGVPLGVWAARRPRAGRWILGGVGLLQTIPALALLAFLIAALDRIGTVPALIALFLYSLLPIVRNTESGLASVPGGMRQAATALGIRDGLRLRLVELPMAARSIVAGIKTSAVINVGTATIAAFVGAGGYGERIVAGLAVNDHRLLLAGAIPAAVMAIALEQVFGYCDRWLVSPGLRLGDGEGASGR